MINKANIYSISLIIEYLWYNPRRKMEDLIKNKVRSKNTLKRYLYGQRYGYSDDESLIDNGILIAHSTTKKKSRKTGKIKSYPDEFEVNQDWLISNINKFPNIKKVIRFGNEDFGYEFYTVDEARKKIEEDKGYREMDAIYQIYESIFANSISHEIKQNPNSKSFYFSEEQRIAKSWLIYGLLLISFAYNPDLWNSLEKVDDFNFEMTIKIDIPKEYQNDFFNAFQKVRDFCMKKKQLPSSLKFPLEKSLAHIRRMSKGLLIKNPPKTSKEDKKEIPFHNDLDVFEAVAYMQQGTYEENKNKINAENKKDLRELIELLKISKPYYQGSQELKSINKQLKKVKKK